MFRNWEFSTLAEWAFLPSFNYKNFTVVSNCIVSLTTTHRKKKNYTFNINRHLSFCLQFAIIYSHFSFVHTKSWEIVQHYLINYYYLKITILFFFLTTININGRAADVDKFEYFLFFVKSTNRIMFTMWSIKQIKIENNIVYL